MPREDVHIDQLIARIEPRAHEIGAQLAARYREEIIDYRIVNEHVFADDITTMATRNLEEFLAHLRTGGEMPEERLEYFRRSGIRRAHQGVPMHALLHAYRLWGQAAWTEIVGAVDVGDLRECAAALEIAGWLMSYVDRVSSAVAAAYLDEVAGVWGDRDVVRRDLLERLISGRVGSELTRRQIAELKLDFDRHHVVVLARSVEGDLHGALDRVTEVLQPPVRRLLVGLRQEEVVAIYPLDGPADAPTMHGQVQQLAAVILDFTVAVGRWHTGIEGIARSHDEAIEALQIAAARGDSAGRAVAFTDVLLDHIVHRADDSEALLAEILQPIREYDDARRAGLMATLRAYFDSSFSLTHAAEALYVHPNTVVYRLKRIKELTGRDPTDPNDMLLLSLGLKLAASS